MSELATPRRREPDDAFFGALDQPHRTLAPPGRRTVPPHPADREPAGVQRPPPGERERTAPALTAPELTPGAVEAAAAPDAPPAARAALATQVAGRAGSAAAGRVAGRAGPQDAFFASPERPPPAASGRGRRGAAPGSIADAQGPDEIRARGAAAARSLQHPTVPSPAGGAPALGAARTGIAVRGAIRVGRASASPRRLAGSPPVPQRPPREAPGPIHTQIEEIEAKSARTLTAAALPAVTRSPRGTLPDTTKDVLTAEEIRAIRVGDQLINAITERPEDRQRLHNLREQLTSGQTTTTPAPAPDAPAAAPAPPTPVTVQDEPVTGVALDPQQRAVFTRVIGELRTDIPHQAHVILDDIRRRHALYPGGVLQTELPQLGDDDILPDVQAAVTEQTGALAAAIGVVPEQFDAAIAERRAEVEALAHQAAQATATAAGTAQTTAAAADRQTTAASQRTAATTARAVAGDRATAARRRPPTVQQRVETSVAEIRSKVATGRARYDAQMRNRERGIGAAVQRQVSAIRLAQTADELALERGGILQLAASGEVRRWAERETAALQDGPNSVRQRLINAARVETETFKRDLDTAAAAAFAALRDWGGRQSTSHEAWWTAFDTNLDTWATQATAHSIAWPLDRGEEARLALLQDLASVQRIVALQRAHDAAGMREYTASLDSESRAVLGAISESSQRGALDTVGALATGMRERVRAQRQGGVELQLQTDLLALPIGDHLKEIRKIVAATQHGLSVQERVAKIHTSVTRWRGFDEKAIFQALEGLTPLGSSLLRFEYAALYEDLDRALHGYGHAGWLDDDEYRTAQQMLRGDAEATVNGAIGAINSAISGLGTDKEEIKRILRSLSDDQRNQVVAGYRSRYGEGLDTAIRGEWISGSQQDEMVALTENRVRDADAIALGRTVETQYTQGDEGGGGGERYATIDRSDAQAVFANIRTEVEAEGNRRNWTSAQIEAEIALRSHEVEGSFNTRFADQWWAKEGAQGTTAMRTAFALDSGPGRDMLNAVADNDMRALDVARIRLEDTGTYAEDSAINAVFRDQNSRSMAEIDRDLGSAFRARADAQLAREASEGRFPTAADRYRRRMELQRAAADELTQLANERTSARMSDLGVAYQAASGRTLSAMVKANMSGAAQREAETRVAQNGVVSNYQRVRFSIEGAGTDLPMLRSAIANMTPTELAEAKRQWPIDHPGETLEQAISGDTSGRDEDDLLDMVNYGPPQTADDVVAAAQRRFDRDRAGGGAIGEWLTSNEVDAARRDMGDLQAELREMHRPGLSPAQQERVMGHFDLAVERANTSIQLQRDAVDAWSDMISNAVALVVGFAVAAAIEFFSGGTATPLVIALVSSIAATVSSMATKRLIRGTAYGLEDFETDLAIGAADALAAALTAGLSKALTGGGSAAARSGLSRTLGEMGRLTGKAARAESAFARLVSRGPATGALARFVERSGVTEGLQLAARPAWQRLAVRGAAQLVETGIQSLPSSFVGAIANERLLREPGAAMRVLRDTWEGTKHSTIMGMGFAAAHAGFGHVVESIRGRAAAGRIPAGDVLGGMGTPRERAADFRRWQAQNPEGSYREFYAERESHLVDQQRAAAETREQLRNARRELLSDLPARERGGYADVPILTATEAELSRLVGKQPGDAHLIMREGQAVIVMREGAPASAARALLPELRERVFAHSGGMTLEGALPEHLRESVPIRRDPSLPTDTVRVVPIPPGGGPITGVEVHVGPNVRPIDVAFHAEAVERVRRWTGAVGEARMALANVAERVGITVDSPADRARFEAIGELEKLQPIIDERIRRAAEVAGDPELSKRLNAEVQHLLTQQERARLIVSGELPAEPRGFIASEGLKHETAPASAGETAHEPGTVGDPVRRANELQRQIQQIETTNRELNRQLDGAAAASENLANQLYTMLERRGLATAEQLGGSREEFHAALSGDAVEIKRAMRERIEAAIERSPPGKVDELRTQFERLEHQLGRYESLRATEALNGQQLELAQSRLSALPETAQLRSELNRNLTHADLSKGPDGICFPPDTPVSTPGGQVPISALRVGDAVVAGGAARRVTRVHRGWTDWLVELQVEGSTLRLTRNHRIRIAEAEQWLPARLVAAGMTVVGRTGTVPVERVTLMRTVTDTYNLEVEVEHTFYAGAGALLVHNGDDDLVTAPRDFADTRVWESEIYYVAVRQPDGSFRTEYVGSTNKEGLALARFEEHLAQGRLAPEHSKYRSDKAAWAREVDRARGAADTEAFAGGLVRRYGNIELTIIPVGMRTDLALALIEQAHMNGFPREQLVSNRAPALGERAFENYYTKATWEKHGPC